MPKCRLLSLTLFPTTVLYMQPNAVFRNSKRGVAEVARKQMRTSLKLLSSIWYLFVPITPYTYSTLVVCITMDFRQ